MQCWTIAGAQRILSPKTMFDWKLYIDRHPDVMLGKPVFKGTRITVEFVLDRLAQGATSNELIANYDGLKPEHIGAALAYAAAAVRHDDLVASL
jgi:uncharacterized protein (DUF433 family)